MKIDSTVIKIDYAGIQKRIIEVPIKPGNYNGLEVSEKALYLMSSETGVNAKRNLSLSKLKIMMWNSKH